MRLDEADSRLVIELQCKMGIKKTYRLTFEECEALQAVYSKETCPNKLVSRPRLLIDIVNNFHSNLDEISFVVTEKMFKVKSYIDDEKKTGPNRVLQTELTVDPKDFEEYTCNTNAGDITFCLKEFKALLQFCEAAGQAISIWFEQGGRPILFSVNFFAAFEIYFVLATLLDTASSSQSSASDPPTPVRQHKQYSASPSTPSSSMADSVLDSSQVSRERASQTPTTSPHSSNYGHTRESDAVSDTGPTSITSSMVDAIGTDKRQRAAKSHDSSGGSEPEDEFVEGTPPSSPPFKRSRKGQ